MSFDLSKLIQTFIEPANAFALLLLVAALLAVSRWESVAAKARRFILFLALVLAVTAAFPVGEWGLMPLENRFAATPLPEKIDGIIMLTGDENPSRSEGRGQPLAGEYASARYIRLAALARHYPKARIVIVGDTAPNFKSKTTTQSLAREIIADMGIDASRVSFEKESRTTDENAALTVRMLKAEKSENWLLLTSAYHMPRSVLCFEHYGMKVAPAQTGYLTASHVHWGFNLDLTKQFGLLRLAAHEYYGLIGYRLTGKTGSFWP